MADEKGGKQMAAFLIKKGDYLSGLAVTHAQSAEHEKAKKLYLQAASWYKKAGAEEKKKGAISLAREQASLEQEADK
ncbi:hypothetical protein GF325_15530 [Candidatus Bathyarchaeota archaeon]|nr:hypothetical protein [Candidatus Bathyarchaeota archaeon]